MNQHPSPPQFHQQGTPSQAAASSAQTTGADASSSATTGGAASSAQTTGADASSSATTGGAASSAQITGADASSSATSQVADSPVNNNGAGRCTQPHSPDGPQVESAAVLDVAIALDGTDKDSDSEYLTNVRLRYLAQKADGRVAIYVPGVGSKEARIHPELGGSMLAVVDLGLAKNLWRFAAVAYKALVQEVKSHKAEEIKEIRIWLDAFSRGSYAGSILASFLHLYGMPPRSWSRLDTVREVAWAWKNFITQGQTNEARRASAAEKGFISQRVWFAGFYDCVSSVLLPSSQLYPGTAELEGVIHYRHIVSQDERRIPGADVTLRSQHDIVAHQEVRFAGTHSNVGGGLKAPGEDKIAAMTLRLMTFFRQEAGDKPTMAYLANLGAYFAEGSHEDASAIVKEAVQKDCVDLPPKVYDSLHDSMVVPYRLAEPLTCCLPVRKQVGGGVATRRFGCHISPKAREFSPAIQQAHPSMRLMILSGEYVPYNCSGTFDRAKLAKLKAEAKNAEAAVWYRIV